MINHKVILQGGGDHARVVVDCLQDLGADIIGIFDPKYQGELFKVPQRGKYDRASYPEALCVIAIGDNAIRKKVAAETAHRFFNVIHPTAVVSQKASIGNGSMILHNTVIQANTKIGEHVIVNTSAQVDHDCHIGSYAHIAPGVVLCGTVTVGEGTFIGAGAVVIPGKKIGRWATVGAGAVVISDLPDYATAVGNPARIVRVGKPGE